MPQHGSVHADWNIRQVRIDTAGLAVIQRTQAVCQRLIVAVGEIVLKLACSGGPQMLCSGLQDPVKDGSYWSEACTGNVDAVEHLVEQCGFASGPGCIESFLQSVVEEVGRIDVDRSIQLAAKGSDIARI